MTCILWPCQLWFMPISLVIKVTYKQGGYCISIAGSRGGNQPHAGCTPVRSRRRSGGGWPATGSLGKPLPPGPDGCSSWSSEGARWMRGPGGDPPNGDGGAGSRGTARATAGTGRRGDEVRCSPLWFTDPMAAPPAQSKSCMGPLPATSLLVI